jgi:hypothetical protein
VEDNYQLLLTAEADAVASVCRSRAASDAVVASAYGFTSSDIASMLQAFEERVPPATGRWRAYFGLPGQDWERPEYGRRVLSWLIGLAWRRWEVRRVSATEGFSDEVLVEAPHERSPARSMKVRSVAAPLPDILVDEAGNGMDIVEAVRQAAQEIAPAHQSEKLIEEALLLLGKEEVDLRSWMRRECFEDHIGRYSKARRKAPLYWQLSIPSKRYSIWLYYHRLTRDTLWRALNDLLKPKIAREQQRLASLRVDAGEVPTPSQRRAIQEQESLIAELATFRDDLETIAPLWYPNLNDGALLNFAPLWKLVPQLPSWQRELRDTWEKLRQGEYAWAHMAMHLWPEQVVAKCAADRSVAIAHRLEGIFWEEQGDGKWMARKVSSAEVKTLIDERSSKSVKAALDKLIARSLGAQTAGRGRGASRRKA